MITHRPAIPSDGHTIIRTLLGDCTRVIDLGCGERHHTKHLPNTVWVDLDPKHASHPAVLVMDAVEAPYVFRRMHFDAALLTDVIEHLGKLDGLELLRKLEKICDRIIIFTPLGPLWIDDKNPSPHAHHSGWTPEDIPDYEHWVWPEFHGNHGAFFAWKWLDSDPPSPDSIARMSGLVDL